MAIEWFLNYVLWDSVRKMYDSRCFHRSGEQTTSLVFLGITTWKREWMCVLVVSQNRMKTNVAWNHFRVTYVLCVVFFFFFLYVLLSFSGGLLCLKCNLEKGQQRHCWVILSTKTRDEWVDKRFKRLGHKEGHADFLAISLCSLMTICTVTPKKRDFIGRKGPQMQGNCCCVAHFTAEYFWVLKISTWKFLISCYSLLPLTFTLSFHWKAVYWSLTMSLLSYYLLNWKREEEKNAPSCYDSYYTLLFGRKEGFLKKENKVIVCCESLSVCLLDQILERLLLPEFCSRSSRLSYDSFGLYLRGIVICQEQNVQVDSGFCTVKKLRDSPFLL